MTDKPRCLQMMRTTFLGGIAITLILSVSQITSAQTFAFVNDIAGTVGIYSINETTGAVSASGTSIQAGMPVGLAITPSGKFLYVTDLVTTEMCAPGYVRGFSVNPTTAALTPLPGAPIASGGTYAYSVAVAPSGKFAYVANSCSNNLSAYSIDQTTGALTLLSSSYSAGTGPGWITIDVFGRFLFVGNTNSQNVSAYQINSTTGALTATPGSPFFSGSYPFRMAEDPSGRFLFVPNANSASVAAFAINASTGALTPVPGSPFSASSGPQAAMVSPSGQFLFVACGYSNQIRAFSINSVTGALSEISASPVSSGAYPYALAQTPDGKFIYDTNARGSNTSAYATNGGLLNLVSGSPFPTGTSPGAIAIAKLGGSGGPVGPQPACGATEVTSSISVNRGAFVGQPLSFGSYSQRITLTNTVSAMISGPLYLVFDGLPQTGTSYCPAPKACSVYPYIAITHCNSPSPNGGSVYGPLSGIAGGGSMTTAPIFYPATPSPLNSPYQMFNYTLRVFAGQPN